MNKQARSFKDSWSSVNMVANFVGTFWYALMGPALVSVYVRFMGVEAYGLVGILTTLQAAFSLLDLGLSAATNRELARFSAQAQSAQDTRDLVRTAEFLYWPIAAICGCVFVLCSSYLAKHWVHPEQLASSTIRRAFSMMGLILACQFPFALYSGALNGLQRQVLLNSITIASATLRGIGSVLLLWLYSPTIEVFFIWQLLVTLFQTIAAALVLWRSLPISDRVPRFSVPLLRSTWRFAAGMTGASVFTFLFLQTDKLVLGKLLPLATFGYYNIATVVASSLLLFVVPIFTTVFPKFSQLIAVKDEENLRVLYHSAMQLLAVLLIPTTLIISFFAPEILQIWLHDPIVVDNVHILVTLLVWGTALNGIMNIPYALQLAAGWTKLPIYQNGIAWLIFLPCLIVVTGQYGAIGAASLWVLVNLGCLVIGIHVMHQRLLRGEESNWYIYDIGFPLMGSLGVVIIGRHLLPIGISTVSTIGLLLCIFLLSLAVALILTPLTRSWLVQRAKFFTFIKA